MAVPLFVYALVLAAGRGDDQPPLQEGTDHRGGDEAYYVGGLVATRTGGSLSFIQPDHLGSASTVTDATGQVTARERYSAFGERRRGESSHVSP